MKMLLLKAWRFATSKQLRLRGLLLAAGLLLVGALSLSVWPLVSPTPAQVAAPLTELKPQRILGDKEVLIGAFIKNIQAINPQTNSFLADVYIWLRWNDRSIRPYKTMEFVNLFESWQLIARNLQDEPMPQPDGSLYFLTHYQGAFNSVLSLQDYPFGSQRLTMEIEDLQRESRELRFVVEPSTLAISPSISIPGYHFAQPTISVENYAYPTSFGMLNSTVDDVYSKVTIAIPVFHPVLVNIFKYILPIVLVMIAAGLIFEIPPAEFSGRISLSITALLTLVAMQWTSAEGLPINSYLTMLDSLYLVSLIFILSSLVQGIKHSWVAREEGEELAVKQDERAMKIFWASYSVVFSGLIIGYLLN
jgi:hypothetical protein